MEWDWWHTTKLSLLLWQHVQADGFIHMPEQDAKTHADILDEVINRYGNSKSLIKLENLN